MVVVLLLALTLPARGGGPLLPCGTTRNFVQDQRQLLDVFEVVSGVCAQRGESCPPGAPLPTSCVSAECQRAVQLAADSCSSAFAKDGFLKSAFKPVLDAAVAVCAAAPHAPDAQVRSREGSLFAASPLTRSAPACRSATSSPATSRPAAHSRCKLVTEAG